VLDSLQSTFYEFYDIGRDQYLQTKAPDYGRGFKTYGMIYFSLYEYSNVHERTSYGIIDLCGDFGGLQYVLLLLANLIVSQFSEVSFNIKAIAKLYNVKT
jgi:hypothetical protein